MAVGIVTGGQALKILGNFVREHGFDVVRETRGLKDTLGTLGRAAGLERESSSVLDM